MSFSFGFFEEDIKISPVVPEHLDNPKDGEISSPQPWWIRVALDVQSVGPAPSQCLQFIERENHFDYIQSARIQGISPHNNRTTLTFGDGFLIDIIRPEKEIKVGDMITDLIPGQYEGGYKLWECSVDLAQYLVAFRSDLLSSLDVSTSGRPLRILELGCGIGLPGIVAQRLLPENSELWLSDFNDTVLMETTWPTLNCCPLEDAFQQGRIQRLVRRAVAGDWLALSSWLSMNNEEPFDLILSAETLYSPPHCEKVAYFLSRHLRPNTGLAVLSNKRFYFGVGGGSIHFADILKEYNERPHLPHEGRFTVDTVHSFTDGSSNIRDIQVLRYHTS